MEVLRLHMAVLRLHMAVLRLHMAVAIYGVFLASSTYKIATPPEPSLSFRLQI